MWRKFMALFLVLAMLSLGLGCATTNGTPSTAGSTAAGTLGGAALGAALGALIGLGTGDVAEGAAYGAIAGAAAGALAGFAYAKHREAMLRDRQAAEAAFNYKPEQGEQVILEEASVTPDTAIKGDQISLNSIFTVLNGSDQPVPVEVTQAILFQGKPIGPPATDKSNRVSGSYVYSTLANVDAKAQEGKYMFITRVKTPNAQDEKMCEFLVAKKAASNQKEIRLVSINGVPVTN